MVAPLIRMRQRSIVYAVFRDEGISTIFCIYYLDAFAYGQISYSFLSNIDSNLDTTREAGLKCVLRFAYTENYSTIPYGDAPKAWVFTHIKQLEPILRENSDVIAAVQAGFIGTWGEWYYTDHFVDNPYELWNISPTQWANRRDVLQWLLDALPPSRMIQVRAPRYKMNTFGTTTPLSLAQAYDNSDLARIGQHNDCFLSTENDYGTYRDSNDRLYTEAESQFTPMGGEACLVSNYSGCTIAMYEMAKYHWSYLNREWSPYVIYNWEVGGCLGYIEQRLGYRFELQNGVFDDSVRPGGQFDMSLSLKNIGWAAPYNPRLVQLLLRNTATRDIYAVTSARRPALLVRQYHPIARPFDLRPGRYACGRLSTPAQPARSRPLSSCSP